MEQKMIMNHFVIDGEFDYYEDKETKKLMELFYKK